MYIENGVIYADVLFAINFSMDFVCLFIAGRLAHRSAKAWRMALASALGALYAFIPFFLDVPKSVAVIAHLIAAAGVTAAAFGLGSAKKLFLTAAAFVASAACTGGMMTAIYGAVSGPTAVDYGGGRLKFAVICVISICAGAIYAYAARTRLKQKSCTVRLYLGGRPVDANLLVDSGNLVTEPFSALPVIVVSHTVLPPPYDKPESGACPLAVRAIPVRTETGDGCLFGFRPDKAEIRNALGKTKAVDAYVGVDAETHSFSGYDGLLPAELL